jgi:hypothetical protein
MTEAGSVAQKWRQENPDANLPLFNPKTLPHRKINHLPKQDNYCDCGLFTLTYIHFFTFSPPQKLNYTLDQLHRLGGTPFFLPFSPFSLPSTPFFFHTSEAQSQL